MATKSTLALVTDQPAPVTSETIADQLEGERAAYQAAVDQLTKLAAERHELLLGDDDQALADHDALIAATERKRDRHQARASKLASDLEAAERREADAARWDRSREVERQCQAAQRWMEREYPRLAAELAAGLAALKEADEAADRMNDFALPEGAPRLMPPSVSRHESATDDRRELQKVQRWVSSTGRPLGSVQIVDGRPNVQGARFVEQEEEVVVPGRKPWWPTRLYDAIAELPGLRRADAAFWPPRR